jgi:transcriptional regulator with XRE-family HTH domain
MSIWHAAYTTIAINVLWDYSCGISTNFFVQISGVTPMQASRLRAVREAAGLTQQDVADRCGISLRQYHRYEMGTSQPSAEHLAAMSKTLGVTSDYLLALTDDQHGAVDEQLVTPLEFQLLAALRENRTADVLHAVARLSESYQRGNA